MASLATQADDGSNPRAVIGGNNPPEETPYEVAAAKLADVHTEALAWLDGAEVESQDQADGLATILDMARDVRKLADEARKVENEPFDTGKAEVQKRYNPLLKQADAIRETVLATLTTWRNAKLAEQRAEAAAKQKEADRLAALAAKARATLDATNLAGRERIEQITADSEKAQREAARAAKPKPTGLRTYWRAEITDPRAAINWYAKEQREGLLAWLQAQADIDARGDRGTVPGVEFVSEQRAA